MTEARVRTRYVRLRIAVANLAANAQAQIAYLDEAFSGITGGRSAEGYGNVELAEELDDIFPDAADHMLTHGELSQAEIDAVAPLSELLDRLCPPSSDPFWQRPALSSDDRWEEIRQLATTVLRSLPDEERDSDLQRGWRNGEP